MYQTIINEMPPHERYIEPFVGGGAILLRKKPAAQSLVVDIDPEVAGRWSGIAASGEVAGLTAVHGDARSVLAALRDGSDRTTLVYCDPPYVRSARRNAKPLYKHEYDDADHVRLLELLLTLPCNVMVSGYRNQIYDAMLCTWRRVDFQAATHAGAATESLWCNFKAAELHDYSYLGADFRERERIKRKKARMRAKLEAMPAQERAAMLDVLLELASPRKAMDSGAHRQNQRGGGRVNALATLDIFSDGDLIAASGERIPRP